MDTQSDAAFPMRHPERWLAVLRIAVGVWFAKAIVTKLSVTLVWGFLPLPTASDRWLHVMPILVGKYARSEEHTSELQSRGHLVCRLLLEKKNPITFITAPA